MSITISNCDEICASPSNTSKSKMLYSFSKSERFPKRRQILYIQINLGVINFTIYNQPYRKEKQGSDTVINTISLKSNFILNLASLVFLLQINIKSNHNSDQTQKKDLVSVTAEAKWK